MAPIKFEENIKDKLEKRTIQPSSSAWDNLSTNLNAHDKKYRKGLIFYIGIAASIIGILFVTNVFFNASENQHENSIIVDIDIKRSENKVETKDVNETIEKEVVAKISEENKNQNEINQVKSSIKSEPKLATIPNQSINKKTINKLEESNETKQTVATIDAINTKKEASKVSTLTFEELKAVEVVNQIKKLEIDNGTVTDTEIENLLKQAERDILKERIYNETTRTVDADALLQDVEDDLEQSFRTKVFEGLRSGSKTLLSAITNRNN